MSSNYIWEFKNGIVIYRSVGYGRQAIPLKSVVCMSIYQENVEFSLVNGHRVSLSKDYQGTNTPVITAIWDAFLTMHSISEVPKDLLTLETS